uniref:Uncharacterized protein n=1 Tax=Arundo donax TaxID=35708 RepID=A0A0A9AHK1_ARUDO
MIGHLLNALKLERDGEHGLGLQAMLSSVDQAGPLTTQQIYHKSHSSG